MREWHTLERQHLLNSVGRKPIALIASEIGRSESSAYSMARKLQREGFFDWSITPYKSKLVTCPECGEKRTKLLVNGRNMCRVCCAQNTLERNIQWRLEAYDALSPTQRANLKIDMPECRHDPKPRKPYTYGMTPQEEAKAIEEWLIATENWEVTYLERVTNAIKQRTWAMRRAAGKKKGSRKPQNRS